MELTIWGKVLLVFWIVFITQFYETEILEQIFWFILMFFAFILAVYIKRGEN